MAGTPTQPARDPVFRTIDLSAEAQKLWGPTWGAPEIAYEFSNGREFELKTEDAGIYRPQT